MSDTDTETGSPSRKHRRVAVIGAGITGLAAAQRLVSMDDSVQVVLFESGDKTGGIIQTVQQDGFTIELGPDMFITNKPGGVQLCEDIGFADQLISTDETFRRSLVLRNGKPMSVPDGFMLMAPANPWAIITTPILSWRGKLRLLREAFVARKPNDADESLSHFVKRRFGTETFERLVQPLVGGIYTADPEKLSLKATIPRFLEMEQRCGSIIRATLAEKKSSRGSDKANSGSGARYGLFVAPKLGFGSLMAAVETFLRNTGRVDIRLSQSVDEIARTAEGWNVTPQSLPPEQFDAVIVCLPTHKAASMMKSSPLQELATCLNRFEYASSAVVVTGHNLDDFQHPLDAFGLVIPHIENRKVLAVSFTSRKFPGRAPAGKVLLRTFVGGATQPELLSESDDTIVAMVHDELKSILGMHAPPIFSNIVRYDNAMPQYHLGHEDLVRNTEEQLQQHSGLVLAGNAYHGVGIPDSIASGRTAAERVLSTAIHG